SLCRDHGTSMLALRACAPLRMRVSMSAMGSVIMSGSPAGLHEPRDLSLARGVAETEAAHGEATVEGTRPAAEGTAVVRPDPELRGPGSFHHEGGLRHDILPAVVRPGTAAQGRAAAPCPRRRCEPWCRSRSSGP